MLGEALCHIEGSAAPDCHAMRGACMQGVASTRPLFSCGVCGGQLSLFCCRRPMWAASAAAAAMLANQQKVLHNRREKRDYRDPGTSFCLAAAHAACCGFSSASQRCCPALISC